MLNKQNVIVPNIAASGGQKGLVENVAHEVYLKMVDYLRLTQSKNQFNRLATYHYLNIPISNSTEPIRGIDYIHPVVNPGVDYATAVITKCLMPNGKVEFEFERMQHEDGRAARQATEMVRYMINSKNDAYAVIRDWAQGALLNKNGVVMVSPVRDPLTMYKEVEGTRDELKVFEIMAAEKGLTAKRQNMRKIDVNLEAAMADVLETGEDAGDALDANAIYRAQYKLTGYSTTVRIKQVAQHYFVCNPTISTIQDQDFCGFYDPMTIHEAKAQYPYIDIESFAEHASYGPAGAYQAGALENDLAIHARDSTPVPGQGVIASAGADRFSRVVMLTTAWIRRDIDNDGEEEIIEVCFSGAYIIYAKEVDFIPLANMCPKPLVGNFFGYSLAERLIPMQEYATSIARAEMAFAMQASTPRIGVNPEFLDAEEIQRGVSAMFVLDRKFDPAKHIYEFSPLQGNLAYVQSAMQRFEQDKMAMVGMTSPSDVLNPEVMKDGNSGYKLQLAMGPNQLIQDEMVKNCAIGLRDALYIVWKTLIQYSDDYNIQQLASVLGDGEAFLDAKSIENFEFIDRRMINIDLALGFLSDENRLTRQQLIQQVQTQFAQAVAMIPQSVPELFFKVRRPFEDTLRVLGIKDVDSYLPTFEEAARIVVEKQQQGPDSATKELDSKTELNKAKAMETMARAGLVTKQTEDIDTDNMFEAMAAKQGNLKAVQID